MNIALASTIILAHPYLRGTKDGGIGRACTVGLIRLSLGDVSDLDFRDTVGEQNSRCVQCEAWYDLVNKLS